MVVKSQLVRGTLHQNQGSDRSSENKLHEEGRRRRSKRSRKRWLILNNEGIRGLFIATGGIEVWTLPTF